MKKNLIITIAIIIIFITIIYLNQKPLIKGIFKNRQENSTITLMAVGDIMLNRGVELMVKNIAGNDYRFPFLRVANYLKKADILFGNLESIISDKKNKKIVKNSPIQVYFKAKLEAIEGLRYAGFDIVSVANNHALDYRRDTFKDSLKNLNKAGISYVGGGFDYKEAYSVKILEVKETKIGFLAYTYPKYNRAYVSWQPTKYKSGVAVAERKNIEEIKKIITKAKKKVDILIVSFHWGNPPFSPIPNSYQITFGSTIIEAGADLIIGHHPHVIQPIERHKNGYIVYSLGNFVFDMHSPVAEIGGLLEITIQNKKIEKVKLKKIKISKLCQPYLVNNH